jgi:hypothetical protein
MVGLIFNAWFTGRQNRIKYTLDLYFQRYANATYNDRANVFYEHRVVIRAATSEAELRKYVVPGAAAVDATGNAVPAAGESIAQSVLYMLNYWETLSTAYVEQHLDRAAFDNVSSEIVCMAVERTAHIIGEKRHDDPEYFENLVAVFWHAATDTQKRGLVPILGGPPGRLRTDDQRAWRALMPPPPTG